MAQSLNKTVELHTTGVSYMAIGGKVGKFLIGDVALEFYQMSMSSNTFKFHGLASHKSVRMYQERELAATLKC